MPPPGSVYAGFHVICRLHFVGEGGWGMERGKGKGIVKGDGNGGRKGDGNGGRKEDVNGMSKGDG